MKKNKLLSTILLLLFWIMIVVAEYKSQGTIGIFILSCFFVGTISLGKAAQLRLK